MFGTNGLAQLVERIHAPQPKRDRSVSVTITPEIGPPDD